MTILTRNLCDFEARHQIDKGLKTDALHLGSGLFQAGTLCVQIEEMYAVRHQLMHPLHRQMRGSDNNWFGFALSMNSDTMLCVNLLKMDWISPAQCDYIGFVVHRSVLEPLWESLYQKTLAAWIEEQAHFTVEAAKAANLRLAHMRVLGQFGMGENLFLLADKIKKILEDLLLIWLEVIPAKVTYQPTHTMRKHKAIVQRSMQLIKVVPEHVFTNSELADLMGVSRRHLHNAFEFTLGLSPKLYTRLVRLNAAHKKIATPPTPSKQNPTIEDIACSLGFEHMGQFARQYKTIFGETPTQTRKRTYK